MRWTLPAAKALCTLLAVSSLPPSAGASAIRERAEAVISKGYVHGLPFSRCLALGDSALPYLASVLHDRSRSKAWANAARAIGVLGESAYFDTLKQFVWNRQAGPLDQHTWRAIMSAQGNMAGIARTCPRALDYLIWTSNSGTWLPRSWTYGKHTREDVASFLAEASLYAVAFVDQPRAYAYIDSLANIPNEARRISALVREKGTLKAWEDMDKEPKH